MPLRVTGTAARLLGKHKPYIQSAHQASLLDPHFRTVPTPADTAVFTLDTPPFTRNEWNWQHGPEDLSRLEVRATIWPISAWISRALVSLMDECTCKSQSRASAHIHDRQVRPVQFGSYALPVLPGGLRRPTVRFPVRTAVTYHWNYYRFGMALALLVGSFFNPSREQGVPKQNNERCDANTKACVDHPAGFANQVYKSPFSHPNRESLGRLHGEPPPEVTHRRFAYNKPVVRRVVTAAISSCLLPSVYCPSRAAAG